MRHELLFLLFVVLASPAWAGEFAPDIYEDDDTPEQAGWIGVDNAPQTHNFDSAVDEDWLLFYLEAPATLTIETFDLSVNCDTFIALYQADGVTPLANGTDDNSGFDGDGASGLLYAFSQAGLYYLRVTDVVGSFGEGTAYSVRVILEVGNLNPATIAGIVFDGDTKVPIGGARIQLNSLASARVTCSPGGAYSIIVPGGTHTLVAKAPGYGELVRVVSAASGNVTAQNFPLMVVSMLDINEDGEVNAVDVQLVINAVLGLAITGNANVNGDGGVDATDIQLVINGALGIQ